MLLIYSTQQKAHAIIGDTQLKISVTKSTHLNFDMYTCETGPPGNYCSTFKMSQTL